MLYSIIIAVYKLLWLYDVVGMSQYVLNCISVKLIIGYDSMWTTEYADLHLTDGDPIIDELFLQAINFR